MSGSQTPFAAEFWVARRAAAEAAAVIEARRGAAELRTKGHADLVTAADEEAERLILDRIRRAFPADAIIAEESAPAPARSHRRWYVDPIDGTTNFVHGHPFACVSVAFADADGVAAGVIEAPLLTEVYVAIRGQGAYLNDRPIRVSNVTDPSAALFATGFPFKSGKGDPERYFRLVRDVLGESHGVRRAGSAALDLAWVAAGRVDGFFEVGLSPWDVAAGMLVVAEAGGRVTGWPGDEANPVDSGRILASNAAVHDWLAEVVGRHAPPL